MTFLPAALGASELERSSTEVYPGSARITSVFLQIARRTTREGRIAAPNRSLTRASAGRVLSEHAQALWSKPRGAGYTSKATTSRSASTTALDTSPRSSPGDVQRQGRILVDPETAAA